VALPAGFVDDLRAALGDAFVLSEPEQLATYDCDGLTGWRATPEAVALPGSPEDVHAVIRLCARDGVPFVARARAPVSREAHCRSRRESSSRSRA